MQTKPIAAAGLLAALLSVFQLSTADPAHALDAAQAEKALMKTPMMKGLKLHEFKSSGKDFTVKLGARKVPAIVFNTGTEKAPIWNVGFYPKTLKLGPAYRTGGGAVLGGIILSNPATVLSAKTATKELKALPKTVQDGIKRVFGSALKATSKITYPAGVNFSFSIDVTKTPGLNLLKSTLGVVDTRVPMAGHMGLDFIRYLVNGKANSKPSELAKVSLTAALKAIKPPKVGRYVNSKNLVVRFVADASGQVRLMGQATVNLSVGKLKTAFASTLSFDAKAKGADQNLITITGKALKPPPDLVGLKPKALQLDARVTGEKKLQVAMAGEALFRKKPVKFGAQVSFAKLPPQLAVRLESDLSVDDLAGAKIPGVGSLAFRGAEFANGYVSGTLAFRGVDTTAAVIRSGNKKPVLALLHKSFDAGVYLPGIKGSALDQAAINNVAMLVVPKGSALKSVAAKDLPGPVGEMIAASSGKARKFQLREGVNLLGAIDVKNSSIIGGVLGTLGVKVRSLPFAGKVSFDVLRNAKKPSKEGLKDKAKAILASLDLHAPLPVVRLPGVSDIINVSKPSLAIRGAEIPEKKSVALTTVVDGVINLMLPGQKVSTAGSITITKGAGKAVAMRLAAASTAAWRKAFGIPFLDLNNVNMAASLDIDAKGKPSVDIGFESDVNLGGQRIRTNTKLIVEKGRIVDLAMALPDDITIQKLPFMKGANIPLLSEIAVRDLTLSIKGVSGKARWTRIPKSEFQAALFLVKGKPSIILSAPQIRVYDLLPLRQLANMVKLPPVPGISVAQVIDSLYAGTNIKFPQLVVAAVQGSGRKITADDLPMSARDMLTDLLGDEGMEFSVENGIGLVGSVGKDNLPPIFKQYGEAMGIFKAVQGNLVVAGSISNLFGGLPSLRLTAALPKFQIPDNFPHKDVPFSKISPIQSGTAKFRFGLNLSRLTFDLGVTGTMGLYLPKVDGSKPDRLKANGTVGIEMGLTTLGQPKVLIEANVIGDVTDPLGLIDGRLTLSDPSFLIGFFASPHPGLQVGFGGGGAVKLANGKRVQSDVRFGVAASYAGQAGYVPIFYPKNLAASICGRGDFSGRLAADIPLAFIKGMKDAPLLNEVVKGVSAVGRDPNIIKGLKQFQRDADKIIADIDKGLDYVPLNLLSLRDPVFFIATPGAKLPGARDMPRKDRDDKDAKCHQAFNLNTIGVRVGGKTDFNFLGQKKPLTDAFFGLTLSDGLEISGKLGNIRTPLFRFEKTNLLVKAALLQLPTFKLSGNMELPPLGIKDETDIEFSANKIKFEVDKRLPPLGELQFSAQSVGKDLLRVRDFVVTARTKTDIDKFVTKEVFPRLGIPKVVGDVIAKSTPLYIDGGTFEGSLVTFLKGGAVTLKLDHKYFGQRMKPAVIEIKPIWSDPLKAFPPVEIARALRHSFLFYLAANPVNLPPVDLGLLKIDKARLTALVTNPKDPKFVVSGATDFLGAKRSVNVALSDRGYAFALKDRIAGLREADMKVRSVGGTAAAPADIAYYGQITNGFGPWVQKQVGGTLSRGSSAVSSGLSSAQNGLKQAMEKVRRTDQRIVAARAAARSNLKLLSKPLKKAREALDKATWLFDKAQNALRSARIYLGRCCNHWTLWLPRKLAEKAVAVAEDALGRMNKKRDKAAKALAKLVKELKQRRAVANVDWHPKVAFWIVAREVALKALSAARLTLAGADELNKTFNGITQALISATAGGEVLNVKKVVVSGRLRQLKTDIHMKADIMGQKDLYMPIRVNLTNPADTDLRFLALTFNAIIRGQGVARLADNMPPPPELPVDTVTQAEISAAVVAAIREKARRAAEAKAKARKPEPQVAAVRPLPSSLGAKQNLWIIGAERIGNDHAIRCWSGSAWAKMPGNSTKIAAGPGGTAAAVDRSGTTHRWDGRKWSTLPGRARDISIGPDGTIWIIDVGEIGDNYGIYRWVGSDWQKLPGSLSGIAAGPNGTAFGVSADGAIHRWDGRAWSRMPGKAREVSVAGDGTIWAIGTESVGNDFPILQWDGRAWKRMPGSSSHIAAGPRGTAVAADRSGVLHHWDGAKWTTLPGRAVDVSLAPVGVPDATFRNLYMATNGNALCLDVSPTHTAAIGSRSCINHGNLRFSFWSDGTIRQDPKDLCLNVQRGGSAGAPVVVANCDHHADQLWRVRWSGGRGPGRVDPTWRYQIVHRASGRCLDLSGGLGGGGAVTNDCAGSANADTWKLSQTWRAAKAPPRPVADRTFRNLYMATNNNAHCLDASPTHTAPLGSRSCIAHGNLRFSLWSDGTIRQDPKDLCLNVQRGGGAGAPVVVANCDPHPDQQWRVRWSGGRGPGRIDPTWRYQIIHRATGRCLDLSGGARGGGAVTADCQGGANADTWKASQTWRAAKSPQRP